VTTFKCPACPGETTFKTVSGGREWDCLDQACGADGAYPEDETPRRLKLLQSPEGVIALRAEMDQELARRREEGS
jgi:hypothetical protein